MSLSGPAGERWLPCLFKGSRVLARADEAGRLLADADGRVEMVYRPGGKTYRAARQNLQPLPEEQGLQAVLEMGAAAGEVGGGAAAPRPRRAPAGEPRPRVVAWTDGACLGNPGPTGAGVLLKLANGDVRAVGRYLGPGTNNIGELRAVLIALQLVDDPASEVIVHTDSTYTLGVLTRPWKPKKNLELIAEIKREMSRFPRVEVRKVPGHAGVPENERVDELARTAAESRRDSDSFCPAPGKSGAGGKSGVG